MGRESISIEWHWTDIQSRNEDLSKAACCNILQWLEENHDGDIGINWDQIDYAIDEYCNSRGEP